MEKKTVIEVDNSGKITFIGGTCKAGDFRHCSARNINSKTFQSQEGIILYTLRHEAYRNYLDTIGVSYLC
jgi:hypothetical protein